MRLLVGLFFSLAAASGYPCSIQTAPAVQVKEKLMTALSNQIGVPKAQIPWNAVTEPQLSSVQPITATCEGIDTIFMSSAYYFQRTSGLQTCTHKGVLVLKGFQMSASTQVLDSTECVGGAVVWHPQAGQYFNLDDSPRHIKRLRISRDGRSVEVWGACGDGECPWGRARLRRSSPTAATAVFEDRAYRRTLQIIDGLNVDLEVHTSGRSRTGREYNMIESFEKR